MDTRRRIAAFIRLMLLTNVAFIAGYAVNSSRVLEAFTAQPIAAVPRIDTMVLTQDLSEEAVAQWKVEVSRRFNDAILVIVHGGDLRGQWQAHVEDFDPMPMTDLIKMVRERHGDRKIVLVSCNPGHYRLPDSVGDVVYATDDVWMMPDSFYSERQVETPTAVGNIYEFLTTNP